MIEPHAPVEAGRAHPHEHLVVGGPSAPYMSWSMRLAGPGGRRSPRPGVDRAAELSGDGVAVAGGVVHSPAGLLAVQAVGDVAVLLEVEEM
jgi:hypothetical protein